VRNLNPADIRVVVKLPKNVGFDADQSTLDMTLTPRGKDTVPVKEHATLKLLAKGRYVPAHVPVAEKGDLWYLTELSADGQRAFRDLQLKLAGDDVKQRYKHLSLNVSISLPGTNEKILSTTRLTVWLHLNQDDDYFPLFEDLKLSGSKKG
jgi:hypothetical protein